MNGLVAFMNGTWGRLLRIILGLVLIYVGLFVWGGTAGVILALVGLAPLIFGAWGRCLLEFLMPTTRGQRP